MIFIIGGAYQGKTAYAKVQFPDAKIVDGYHETVREQLQSGKDPVEEAVRFLGNEPDRDKLVIISTEIGYGIVPLDRAERDWREANGRVNCFFAREADRVIRVTCGIGERLK